MTENRIIEFPTKELKDCPMCGGDCNFIDGLNLIIGCNSCDMIFSCNKVEEKHVVESFNRRKDEVQGKKHV